MHPVYLIDCPGCKKELAYRGMSELPEEEPCPECGKVLPSVGTAAFEEYCIYCGNHNFYSEWVEKPRCTHCGFIIPKASPNAPSDRIDPVGVIKSIIAGIKTGDIGSIVVVVGIVLAVIAMFWARS